MRTRGIQVAAGLALGVLAGCAPALGAERLGPRPAAKEALAGLTASLMAGGSTRNHTYEQVLSRGLRSALAALPLWSPCPD